MGGETEIGTSFSVGGKVKLSAVAKIGSKSVLSLAAPVHYVVFNKHGALS